MYYYTEEYMKWQKIDYLKHCKRTFDPVEKFKKQEYYFKWRNRQISVCDVCGIEIAGNESHYIDQIPYCETLELCHACYKDMIGGD